MAHVYICSVDVSVSVLCRVSMSVLCFIGLSAIAPPFSVVYLFSIALWNKSFCSLFGIWNQLLFDYIDHSALILICMVGLFILVLITQEV